MPLSIDVKLVNVNQPKGKMILDKAKENIILLNIIHPINIDQYVHAKTILYR